MNTKTIAGIAIVLIVLGIGYAVAKPTENNLLNNMMGGFGGMMGNTGMMNWNGYNGMMPGGMMGNANGHNGMMSGGMMGNANGHNGMMLGGMMGIGYGYKGMISGGMMGGSGSGYCSGIDMTNQANNQPITIVQAKEAVDDYLSKKDNNDLALAEVIEFENNFYAGVKKRAQELMHLSFW